MSWIASVLLFVSCVYVGFVLYQVLARSVERWDTTGDGAKWVGLLLALVLQLAVFVLYIGDDNPFNEFNTKFGAPTPMTDFTTPNRVLSTLGAMLSIVSMAALWFRRRRADQGE